MIGYAAGFWLAAQAAVAAPPPLRDQALLDAAAAGDAARVRQQLEDGADYNAASAEDGGKSALMLSVESGDARAVELLIDHGASIGRTAAIPLDDRTTLEQVTPLARAVMLGKTGIADFLIDRGAEPLPAVMVRKLTPLGQVARTEQPLLLLAKDDATTRLLLKSGADVDDAASDGTTPLMRAAERGDAAAMQTLLSAGADTQARRKADGATAASLAVKAGHAGLAAKLNPKPVLRTRPSLN